MCKDKIVFQLINTEQNKEMLANMPQEFKDLSVIYRMVVKLMGKVLHQHLFIMVLQKHLIY